MSDDREGERRNDSAVSAAACPETMPTTAARTATATTPPRMSPHLSPERRGASLVLSFRRRGPKARSILHVAGVSCGANHAVWTARVCGGGKCRHGPRSQRSPVWPTLTFQSAGPATPIAHPRRPAKPDDREIPRPLQDAFGEEPQGAARGSACRMRPPARRA